MNVAREKKKNRLSYRHIARYGEIASVLVRYGFGDLLSRLKIDRFLRSRKNKRPSDEQDDDKATTWDRVRMALEQLGPAFVKLGQFASNRPDFLPSDLIYALEKLQDSVPPFNEKKAVEIIESELGDSVGTLFTSFTQKPFASASIAQVHRARLSDGSEVAVKIQRPDIADIVAVDCEIMLHIAMLMENHIQGMDVLRPTKLVEEFSSAIRKELDFTIEAMHFERFAVNFRGDENIHIPDVYMKYSARRVITTEFINGVKVTDLRRLVENGGDPVEVAKRGAAAVLKQIFVDGFFHADPHAGNILVRNGNEICFLDLGMTGLLTPSSRERLCAIIIGMVRQNPQKVVTALAEMSYIQLQNREELEYEISELMQEYIGRSIKTIDISEVLNRLLRIMSVHQIRMLPGFYLLVKAIVTIEGVALKLDPHFTMMEHLEPFVRTMVREQYSLKNVFHDGSEAFSDMLHFVRDLPSETRELLQLVKSGQVKFEFEHRGLEPVSRRFEQVVNRIVFGLVLASLVIGSSIVIHSNIPPSVYGYPVIGLAGFLAAGIIGFWLLISTLRHGKM